MADGSISSIVGQGPVRISPTLSLNHNLLSTRKITKDQNCLLSSLLIVVSKTIGHGKLKDSPRSQRLVSTHKTNADQIFL